MRNGGGAKRRSLGPNPYFNLKDYDFRPKSGVFLLTLIQI
jgi:hypothetical protein